MNFKINKSATSQKHINKATDKITTTLRFILKLGHHQVYNECRAL